MKITNALQKLGVTNPLIYGCMGLGGGWNQNPVSKDDIRQANEVIDRALESGFQLFDHADIYTFGKAEQVFGEVLKSRPELKEQMVLQSKCGIRFDAGTTPKRYDFSKEWISSSVEGILERLNIEHLPILLLHRPDVLMDVEEVAEVFSELQKQGKVGQFGVSNMSASQMQQLQSKMKSPLVANQLEMSLSKLDWLEQSILNNVGNAPGHSFTAGTIEYCQSQDVQIQAWGSMSQGLFSGRNVNDESHAVQQTAEKVRRIAAEKETSTEAVILAWLMKHPANVMPVVGTTNIDRIKAAAQATKIELSRDQWYELYVSARGEELP